VQRSLLEEVMRTSRDGAVMLVRSVDDDAFVDKHGFDRHFIRMNEASDVATALDRSSLYRRVDFYQVAH